MGLFRRYAMLPFVLVIRTLTAQPDTLVLTPDEHYVLGELGEDPSPELYAYEALNKTLGGDSIRTRSGHPCIGWVEDIYPDGTLKHRGYYDQGHLTVYRNYHPNGKLERDFKPVDAVKSVLRTYHSNGQLRSEARYANGVSSTYEDHYLNGALRYAEERHRTEPYYIRMDLFASDGKPISLLQLTDKKMVEFDQKEYYPGGALRCEGKARYNASRMDTQRVGTWTYYDAAGTVARAEDYQEGKVAMVR